MSVRQYDEEPFPFQIEHYPDLARGQWIEVRANDVAVPVGVSGVVLKKVEESGNYQVAVEVEGRKDKRIVALCPDQLRPIDPPLPTPEPAAAPKANRSDGWTPEKRAEQAERVREMWARKKAERASAQPAPEPAKRRLKEAQAAEPPEPEPHLITDLAEAIRQLQDYREDRPASPAPRIAAVTWTRRAADALRPVLAEAATGGADALELALLVETISHLEDGGRP